MGIDGILKGQQSLWRKRQRWYGASGGVDGSREVVSAAAADNAARLDVVLQKHREAMRGRLEQDARMANRIYNNNLRIRMRTPTV